MKIAIVGLGYVGLSLATLLSQYCEVCGLDISSEKVEKINNRICPIKDEYIEKYFKEKKLDLKATLNYKEAFKDAKFIIISTPTNYDDSSNEFDTSSIEDIIKKVLNLKVNSTIIIKSTVPVGFIQKMKDKYNIKNIFFSPEFLREGNALYDNLYASRIIVGEKNEEAKIFGDLLKKCCLKSDVKVMYMNSTEAEAVKLFSNAYLALRISYFNELDTFAELKGLNTKDIIEGVCLDPRIGNNYNNPSFGYGGYCLPKDTKQLNANYKDIPEDIISSIVKSNKTRKEHIVQSIINKKPKLVGIYRLTMKSNSDNFRESAIIDIIELLLKNKINITIYEPYLDINNKYYSYNESNLESFKKKADIVIANRIDSEINDILNKVYSRDIYNNN